jgi:transcriptional regulator with XRE-family HTH domain
VKGTALTLRNDPGRSLARRLRALREEHWPGVSLTQAQLAEGISVGKSVTPPAISSWEQGHRIPPPDRLEAYARFFATRRSILNHPRLLPESDLTPDEGRVRDELQEELMGLRNAALEDPAVLARTAGPGSPRGQTIGSGTWHFADQRPITIVCALLPGEIRKGIPWTDRRDPDYVEAFTYADLDAMIELHGHIRAVNPLNRVNFRLASQVAGDDLASHLILLGGVDFNYLTREMQRRLKLPVLQISETVMGSEWDPYYKVEASGGDDRRFRPTIEEVDGRKALVEDVGLLVRAPNPYNRKRTVTMCNAVYARGVFGVVRALTDANFRDRNERFLENQFGRAETFGVLTRVQLSQGTVITPDWTQSANVLYNWSEDESDPSRTA